MKTIILTILGYCGFMLAGDSFGQGLREKKVWTFFVGIAELLTGLMFLDLR